MPCSWNSTLFHSVHSLLYSPPLPPSAAIATMLSTLRRLHSVADVMLSLPGPDKVMPFQLKVDSVPLHSLPAANISLAPSAAIDTTTLEQLHSIVDMTLILIGSGKVMPLSSTLSTSSTLSDIPINKESYQDLLSSQDRKGCSCSNCCHCPVCRNSTSMLHLVLICANDDVLTTFP